PWSLASPKVLLEEHDGLYPSEAQVFVEPGVLSPCLVGQQHQAISFCGQPVDKALRQRPLAFASRDLNDIGYLLPVPPLLAYQVFTRRRHPQRHTGVFFEVPREGRRVEATEPGQPQVARVVGGQGSDLGVLVAEVNPET